VNFTLYLQQKGDILHTFISLDNFYVIIVKYNILFRKTKADISSEWYVIHIKATLPEVRRLGNSLSPSSVPAVKQRWPN